MDIRPSPIAGKWYSGNQKQLASQIDLLIQQTSLPVIQKKPVGLIVPHAGHIYSGAVAAAGYAAVKAEKPDLVILLSPSHHYAMHPLLVSGHDAYATPLGNLEVDREGVEAISAYLKMQSGLSITPVHQDQEHAIEIQIPFLQRIYSHDYRFVPIMIADQSMPIIDLLAKGIADLFKDVSTLLIASTDLSHFFPEGEANRLDQNMLNAMMSFSTKDMYLLEQTGEGSACGVGAAAAVLEISKRWGANQAQMLGYATSGKVTGDKSSVVGYGTILFSADK